MLDSCTDLFFSSLFLFVFESTSLVLVFGFWRWSWSGLDLYWDWKCQQQVQEEHNQKQEQEQARNYQEYGKESKLDTNKKKIRKKGKKQQTRSIRITLKYIKTLTESKNHSLICIFQS